MTATGATPNVSGVENFPVSWTSAGLSDGVYRVAAKITTAGGRVRYTYVPRPLYVSAGGAELINKRFTNDIANNAWSEARNFTPGGVPAAGAHVLLPAGGVAIPVDAVDQSLVVGAGATAAFSTSQHLNALTLGPGATATIASGGKLDSARSGTETQPASSGTLSTSSTFDSMMICAVTVPVCDSGS